MILTFRFCAVLCLILPIVTTANEVNGKCKLRKDRNKECGEHSYEIIAPMLDYFKELNIEKKSSDKQLKELRDQLNNATQKLEELTKKHEETQIQLSSLVTASEALKKNYEECRTNRLIADIQSINSQAMINGIPSTCAERQNYTGTLLMQLKDQKPFLISCDATVDGSGWTVIQRRKGGLVDFYLKWAQYKAGFGNVEAEFFIGLDRLHRLTKGERYELYIQLIDQSNEISYARYDNFVIESEQEDYRLSSVGQYTGNAGDSLSTHVGNKFSTRDRDHDTDSNRKCAEELKGAWWYTDCGHSNLNGRSFKCSMTEPSKDLEKYGCIYWEHWHGRTYSLQLVQMMIRPWRLAKT